MKNNLRNEDGLLDTDAVEAIITEQCTYLASKKWTELFEFRPTFELVARYVYEQLEESIDQLVYVEIINNELGVKTKFFKYCAAHHMVR